MLTPANRPRLRAVRRIFASLIGEIEPHSHIRWSAIKPILPKDLRYDPSTSVLEVACGSGEMTLELQEALRPGRMIAFDIQRPGISQTVAHCFIGDATRIPLRSNSQDVVTLFDVIEHIDSDSEALREVVRVLKPGGRVLVTVPTPAYPKWFGRTFHESLGHVRDGYTKASLATILRRSGMEISSIDYHTGIIFLIFARLYYGKLRFNVYASAIATVLIKPLALFDRHLPSPTWGGISCNGN